VKLVGCLPPSKFLVLLPPLSEADSEVQEHRRYYGRPIVLTATPHFQKCRLLRIATNCCIVKRIRITTTVLMPIYLRYTIRCTCETVTILRTCTGVLYDYCDCTDTLYYQMYLYYSRLHPAGISRRLVMGPHIIEIRWQTAQHISGFVETCLSTWWWCCVSIGRLWCVLLWLSCGVNRCVMILGTGCVQLDNKSDACGVGT
jgi:hypothetical protein